MKNIVLLLYFVGISAFAQSGAGGIGTNNGASNLRLWVKADAGTNLSSNQVTSWTDLSGSGNTATAITAGNRPTHIINTLNSYPVVRFDGINNYLEAGTATSLDMTQWSFLVVGKVNNNKNYNYWFGKGNDAAENYEFLTYADPFFHTPIYFTDGTRNWANTGTTTVINNYAIWQYDYSTAGRNVYLNGTSLVSDAVSKTPQTNGFVMWIGNERSTTGRFLDGDIAELVMFNTRQNDVQRIILQNYLSAKYDITLTGQDVYIGDNSTNGNYDHGVAGIGRSSTGNTHTSFSPSASNGLGMTYVSGFDNGDFVMVGHNLNTLNNQQFSDIAGMTGVAKARWRRVWYFDVTNTSTNIVANLSFDMSDGDVMTTTPTIASNYVLLYRAGQTGAWTEVTNATNISGDAVNFNNQTLTNDGYYTIGTRNYSASPLPINITAFWAVTQVTENQVLVNWETVSQGEVHHFDVLRSQDGVQWEMLAQVAGENNKKAYQIIDKNPLQGVSYYKLVSSEAGRQDQSYITSVQMDINVLIYPNPCSEKLIIEGCDTKQTLLTLYNAHGQKIQAHTSIKDDKTIWVDVRTLPAGMYHIDIRNNAPKQSLKRSIVIQ